MLESNQSFTVTPQQALELGWSIIPVHANKIPMVTAWKPYQTRQPTKKEFEAWLKWNPPLWAVITGSLSGRIVLDFDGERGCETLRSLDIPAHRSTPSSGLHADFTHPGWPVSSLNGKSKRELGERWPGMDIRADRAYAIFAGETERGRYSRLREPAPHPLTILPDELRKFLRLSRDSSPGASGGSGGVDTGHLIHMALARISSHGRNDGGLWLAVQLRDNRFSQSAALEALQAYRALCPPVNRKGEREEYTEAEMLGSLDQTYSRAPRGAWDPGKKNCPDVVTIEPPPEPNAPTPGEDGETAPQRKQFEVTPYAVFYTGEEGQSKTFVCSRLDVLAYARDPNSESWGRLLRWIDRAGKVHYWIVPMRLLVGDGIAVRETLADGGLDIGTAPKTNHLLAQYIRTERPQRYMYCVPYTGWLDRCFVMPENVIPEGSDVGYQSAGRGEHFYRTSSTLESWRKQIGEKCIGNSRLTFAVSAAFAGPLLRPLNIQSGGFHFRALSSMGKSTTLWVAGSVWGGGGRNGFARTWATTKNAAESIAELHNDGCLILDEIRLIDPREVEQIIYMLANGSGKSRETRNLTGRRTLQWNLMILSSGEIPLSDCAALAGHKIKGGAEIRMATIPADAGAGMGVFEQLHGTDDPRIFAELLEAAAKQHYGWPIRAFLAYVIANWDRVMAEAAQFIEDFIGHYLPPGAAPEVRRVLRRFAASACAGEIATEAGITGWKEGDATAAAAACFYAWLKERGGVEATDTRNAIQQVREIIAAHHARFYAADPVVVNGVTVREHIPNALGYWKKIDEEVVYLVNQDAFRNELCRGFHHLEVAKELYKRGILLKNQADRWTSKEQVTLPTGVKEKLWFYGVTARVLQGEEEEGGGKA
jgi:uncharacterized protein (DUF927 family)